MRRFNSRTRVVGGYYLSTSSWKIHAVEGESGELPGIAGTDWVRLATPVMVLCALGLSLAFVVFLPAIGLGLFAWVVARAMARAVRAGAERLAHTFAPHWMPGEAWLARRDETTKKDASLKAPESLEALRRQVDARRSDEEPPKKAS